MIADGHIAQKQVLDAVKFHADDQRVAGDIQIGIVRAAELIQGIVHGNVVCLPSHVMRFAPSRQPNECSTLSVQQGFNYIPHSN